MRKIRGRKVPPGLAGKIIMHHKYTVGVFLGAFDFGTFRCPNPAGYDAGTFLVPNEEGHDEGGF